MLNTQVIQTLNTQSLNHRLAHDNLEPFRIVYITNMGISLPAIVTSWYENKDVLEYIRRNPEVDKLAMAYQTASALCYLHGQGIVHGNIYPVSPSSRVLTFILNFSITG